MIKTEEKQEEDKDLSSAIIDTRFQSFTRVYIHDLMNAEIIDPVRIGPGLGSVTKKGIIKLNGIYIHKVAICGTIVFVYDTEKYYRLKIDDSSGVASVKLWKNCVLNEDRELDTCSKKMFQQSMLSSSQRHFFEDTKPPEIYDLIESIQKELKDKSVNHSILYEPKQGDLVLIRANVQHYKERIELSAVSCVRVQNSVEELTHLILPSILADKCYSVEPPRPTTISESVEKIDDDDHFKENKVRAPIDENRLIEIVYKRLIDLAKSRSDTDAGSCSSYHLYNSIRNVARADSVGVGFVSHKQVLNALKVLEMRGMIYSCEDEFHYMPII